MGYSLWGRRESDTTEQLSTHKIEQISHLVNLYKIPEKLRGPALNNVMNLKLCEQTQDCFSARRQIHGRVDTEWDLHVFL